MVIPPNNFFGRIGLEKLVRPSICQMLSVENEIMCRIKHYHLIPLSALAIMIVGSSLSDINAFEKSSILEEPLVYYEFYF